MIVGIAILVVAFVYLGMQRIHWRIRQRDMLIQFRNDLVKCLSEISESSVILYRNKKPN